MAATFNQRWKQQQPVIEIGDDVGGEVNHGRRCCFCSSGESNQEESLAEERTIMGSDEENAGGSGEWRWRDCNHVGNNKNNDSDNLGGE
jgi:hypothetical protein